MPTESESPLAEAEGLCREGVGVKSRLEMHFGGLFMQLENVSSQRKFVFAATLAEILAEFCLPPNMS